MIPVSKVVFVSNFFNHHQKFLSDAFYELIGDGYHFIATVPMNEDRRKLGWKQYETPYLVYSYESDEVYQSCMDLIRDADAVIIGSAPEKMIRSRILSGKLTFRYSERFLRKGLELKKFLYRLVKYRHLNPGSKPVYLLCSSAYTSADYAKFGLFRNKAFKWAYFTEAKAYEDLDLLLEKKDPMEILWCGRFLKLKHLGDVIHAVGKLVEEGFPCRLKVIGGGSEQAEAAYRKLACSVSSKDFVSFVGTVGSDEVRTHMEKAGIFVFSSDFQEGWGAVVNEAMNSGCAVISSHAAGAAPFLIRDGENGMIYESQNVADLYQKLKELLEHPEHQRRLGAEAYRTITGLWSPAVAAKRFLSLAQSILNNKGTDLYEEGPVSKSLPLNNNWYHFT